MVELAVLQLPVLAGVVMAGFAEGDQIQLGAIALVVVDMVDLQGSVRALGVAYLAAPVVPVTYSPA